MRAERIGAISGLESKMPDALYIGFVDSLLVEIRALILSTVAVTLAGLVAAYAAQSATLWIFIGVMALVNVVRMHFMVLHSKSRPSPDVATASRRETIFVIGAVIYMGLLATWTLCAFWVTDDAFPRFLISMATISYAFGMLTRSFAIDRGLNAQILVAFLPLSAAMIVAGGWYPTVIFVAFVPIFLLIKAASTRMKENFLAEVGARQKAALLAGRLDTALNNMSHGLCMVDPAGRLSLTNSQVLRIFGLSEADAHVGTEMRAVIRKLVRNGVVARAEFKRLSQALFRKGAADLVIPLETKDQRARRDHAPSHEGREHGRRHPGHHRAAHRRGGDLSDGLVRSRDVAAQPAPVRGEAVESLGSAQKREAERRYPVSRSRRFQAGQRQPRPRPRRQAALGGRRAPALRRAGRRHRRALGRRRIRHSLSRDGRDRTRLQARRADHRGDQPAVPDRRL